MATNTKSILVTGTNGALGLGICQRLIDDFLQTHPSSVSLNLIVTTRSSKKGQETVRTLQSQIPSASTNRISIRPENVELTNLLSIRALAAKLNESDLTQLDGIICNAGIAGWSGLDWARAVADILAAPRMNTTFPQFKLGIAGLVTDRQFPPDTLSHPEPPLGQVFCANVLGHYMLIHLLMPLLRACPEQEPGRIIWISSIEPQAEHFNEDDFQGLRSHAGYENTKRIIDVLALTYDSAASSTSVRSFASTPGAPFKPQRERPSRSVPTMHTTQPGVLPSTIMSLYWLLHQAYVAAIWLVRLIGGPWSTFSAYVAAMSITWLALAPSAEIKEAEAAVGENGRRVKWGTGVTRFGVPSARPTEVEGWGLNGGGASYAKDWWAGSLGRHPKAAEAKKEDVEEFVALGSRVWKHMESLRTEWETRLEEYESKRGK